MRILKTFMLALLYVMVPAVLFAQADPPSADTSVAGIVTAVMAAVIPFIVAGVRKIVPKIPRLLVPLVTFLVSAGATYVQAATWGGGFSVTKAAILAGAAWILREIYTTFSEHGLS